MAEFLAELYVSRGDSAAARRRAKRARLAAEELRGEGTEVRYVRSIHVPEEETCFFLYEAASAAAVREVMKRSAVRYERVTEVASWSERQITAEGEQTP